jgi:uncharacterized protein with HEPN domain
MIKKHSVLNFLDDIVKAIDDISLFTEGMDIDQFEVDRKTYFAVVQRFSTIGEAVKKIPNSVKDTYSSIPWKTISGMRDNLIHDYFNIECELIWKAIHNDLGVLKSQILEIVTNQKDKE